ncbi:bifunctional phosphoribosyl-AMP cyclohydrolase/phosphoribosyl-ATP diphosphatase HisIE [Acetonema longum]|uniref:Histidine biosynthesis bifunctional protein HisIE n=1 Tax=Acetonema longum DSM 6540 TaxID=1009370 RepID=F7NEP4_9FIRM|nr:bifunctional phosphoribosyl-AMP cyclohydrolase/phosphoribosyl-ATP diphosphatase HisIE [Acetonema longum]EGO65455.1 phosphoribosyl-AMP cyclohydrolase [Acetonema longum DSM 6540]
MNLDLKNLKFDANGLMPAVIQDAHTGAVLMLAYMNQESLEKTIATGLTWFYSRSRQRLWNKGETSGHIQKVREIYFDCDADTLLVKVEQVGVACHEGSYSCFSRKLYVPEQTNLEPAAVSDFTPAVILNELYGVITDRKTNRKEGSYTNYLFDKGQDKILKKVGEEAAETIIASKNQDENEILYEMADLWYHCLVLLSYHNLTPAELLKELHSRRK